MVLWIQTKRASTRARVQASPTDRSTVAAVNRHEIQRLAGAVHVLRPDWPTNSLKTFLDLHLRSTHLLDGAVALVWVACDPITRTPRRVLEAGPWWRKPTTPRPSPTARTELCRHCNRAWAQCQNPVAQQLDPHEFITTSSAAVGPEAWHTQLRQELERARNPTSNPPQRVPGTDHAAADDQRQEGAS